MTTYERRTFAFSRSLSAFSASRPPVFSGSRVNIHGSPGVVKAKTAGFRINVDIHISAFHGHDFTVAHVVFQAGEGALEWVRRGAESGAVSFFRTAKAILAN